MENKDIFQWVTQNLNIYSLKFCEAVNDDNKSQKFKQKYFFVVK